MVELPRSLSIDTEARSYSLSNSWWYERAFCLVWDFLAVIGLGFPSPTDLPLCGDARNIFLRLASWASFLIISGLRLNSLQDSLFEEYFGLLITSRILASAWSSFGSYLTIIFYSFGLISRASFLHSLNAIFCITLIHDYSAYLKVLKFSLSIL